MIVLLFNRDLPKFNEPFDSYKLKFNYLEDFNYWCFKASETDILEVNEINIVWYNLSHIPTGIFKFKNLKILNLNNNLISKIPEEIFKLKKLELLWLNDNRITEIPENIIKLKNLKELCLSKNRIPKIPEVIFKLTSLERLNWEFNGIKEIPENISELKNLKILCLANNNLKSFPEIIFKLKNLEGFYLQNNLINFDNDQKRQWYCEYLLYFSCIHPIWLGL